MFLVLNTVKRNWNRLSPCNRSCLSHLPFQYIGSLSPTVKQQMQQPQQCWDYSFYTSSGWPEFVYVTNPCPTGDGTCDLQITLPRTLMLPFFSILLALHMQDTFVLILNFEVGHFARHFLFLSFSLLVLLWKGFNPHSFIVTFHFSRSSGSSPVFFLYSTPLISLNNKPQLAHRRQHSAGSAFQFPYRNTKITYANKILWSLNCVPHF